jgi:hypothetical protein
MIVKYFSERQYTKVSVDEYSANEASRDQTRDFKKPTLWYTCGKLMT